MEIKSDLLKFWEDNKPIEGYKLEEDPIVKKPLNNVEDALFAFIMTLLY